jgi:hypothetical protein
MSPILAWADTGSAGLIQADTGTIRSVVREASELRQTERDHADAVAVLAQQSAHVLDRAQHHRPVADGQAGQLP